MKPLLHLIIFLSTVMLFITLVNQSAQRVNGNACQGSTPSSTDTLFRHGPEKDVTYQVENL